VKAQDGSVYTGTLKMAAMAATAAGRPVQIQEVEDPKKEVAIDSSRLVEMTETSEKFWQRFNGGVNTGLTYSKGNQATQPISAHRPNTCENVGPPRRISLPTWPRIAEPPPLPETS
jgi:hypothetical protein